jgi:hypothetical protein
MLKIYRDFKRLEKVMRGLYFEDDEVLQTVESFGFEGNKREGDGMKEVNVTKGRRKIACFAFKKDGTFYFSVLSLDFQSELLEKTEYGGGYRSC